MVPQFSGEQRQKPNTFRTGVIPVRGSKKKVSSGPNETDISDVAIIQNQSYEIYCEVFSPLPNSVVPW